jgi:hypothetical protein
MQAGDDFFREAKKVLPFPEPGSEIGVVLLQLRRDEGGS